MAVKIVIVGGVAGGAGAAAKARRSNENAEIVLFERGPYVSFANCGLPYYVGGNIPDRKSLFLQSPEGFWKRFRVNVRVRHEVLRVNRSAKTVTVKDLSGGRTFDEPYDKLVLAPGAGAIVPDIPNARAANVFTVKTVPDSDAIRAFMDEHKPRNAVVVGAGFIGLESAEALKRRGLDVTVVELLPQVLPPFDPDMAGFVAQHLESNGVRVSLGDGVKAFHGTPLVKEVELSGGRRIPADLVILSIGVRPEIALAKEAGLAIGETGGIAVNERQQTSDPDIYAAGDAVEVTQLVTGRKVRMPLAGPANKQGRVAGANAAGDTSLVFPGALGTAIVETMGITAARTGLNEREAKNAGIASFVTLTHSLDHAGYYPGAGLLHIKLLAEKNSGRLIGAQVVGEHGVDKRIDVLATALSARMTVKDLEQLDLAYAPQFSSAKDPVVMAGFVAANVLRSGTGSITCEELQQRLDAGESLQIVDVRTREEHGESRLAQAKLIPVDELRERLGELDAEKETVVYCRIGLRGYLAARILQQHGFKNVLNLAGGMLSCAQGPSPSRRQSPAETTAKLSASSSELKEALASGSALAWDVRDPDEFLHERIEGASNVPLASIEKEAAKLPKNRELFVFCQTGLRTKEAVDLLRGLGFTRVRPLEGGLAAWKAAGFATKRSGPIPVMRQVQIVAGSFVLLGGLIPGWHWLAAFVGAGLVFAGVSGRCGMATVLAKLPWNKSKNRAESGEGGCGSCSG